MIQDVVTRWWSTYRAIRRARFLRLAIAALCASGQVKCKNLYEYQWDVLHQVEMALEPLASAQRILEGESYPTGSLVPYAVHKIMHGFRAMIHDKTTLPCVVSLAKTMLDDFLENRYDFVGGMVKYPSSNVVTGRMNRYTTVHQYNFFSALLDPRMKGNLRTIMVIEQYETLVEDLLEVMVMQEEAAADELSANKADDKDADDEDVMVVRTMHRARNTFHPNRKACLFDDFDAGISLREIANNNTNTKSSLREDCHRELVSYLQPSVHQKIKNSDGDFNNPLKWWAVHEFKYAKVAKMAKVFLPIPATSSPSEKVWRRSSDLISIKRAKLSPDLASSIMFTKENVRLLYKYYEELTGKPLVDAYLPVNNYDAETFDCGQDDHNLDM